MVSDFSSSSPLVKNLLVLVLINCSLFLCLLYGSLESVFKDSLVLFEVMGKVTIGSPTH